MALQARGHAGLDVDGVAEHGQQQQADADGVGGQRGQPVAAEHEGAGADQAGHADAGGEQLEHDEGQADHEQEVGHRRARHRVHQLAAEGQLREPGLADRLAVALVALAHDPALHPVEAEHELADGGGGVVGEPELDGGVGAHLVADRCLAAQRAVAEQGPGDLDAALGRHADRAGGGQHLRGVAGGLAARRADPDVDRHGRPFDALDEGVETGIGDDRAAAVELQDEGEGVLALGLGDLGLDEVDEHPVEQAAHLDDRHVAGIRRLLGRRRRRSAPGARPAGPRVRAPGDPG